ncbi:MAG: DNA polymerase ligase N-terminal domain-containing protein [Planctomycetota bacterium]|jgi:hypothetical protein
MGQRDNRFVIQEHTRSRDVHWDLMLEFGDILQTYRLKEAPDKVLRHAVNAKKIFDHPLKFLTYEGPVNNGRGSVRIIEAGTYQLMHQKYNRIELSLSGQILRGEFTLNHIKYNDWRFIQDSPSKDQ